ncbi:MAG: hypothetical protein U1E73_10400 [Planctomycetota bacterium]
MRPDPRHLPSSRKFPLLLLAVLTALGLPSCGGSGSYPAGDAFPFPQGGGGWSHTTSAGGGNLHVGGDGDGSFYFLDSNGGSYYSGR